MKHKTTAIIHDSRFALREQRCGQSLVEVLIAMVIGTVMVIAAVSIIVPVLKSSTTVNRTAVAAALGKELLSDVEIAAEANWNTVASLATSSANHYHLSTTTPFTAIAGDETVSLATSTFTRYFYVDNVGRDAAGNIVPSGGANDPSTKKLTTVYLWPIGVANAFTTYLTRSKTRILWQRGWAGGPGQDGPMTSTNSMFASSSNISFASTTGSLIISL